MSSSLVSHPFADVHQVIGLGVTLSMGEAGAANLRLVDDMVHHRRTSPTRRKGSFLVKAGSQHGSLPQVDVQKYRSASRELENLLQEVAESRAMRQKMFTNTAGLVLTPQERQQHLRQIAKQKHQEQQIEELFQQLLPAPFGSLKHEYFEQLNDEQHLDRVTLEFQLLKDSRRFSGGNNASQSSLSSSPPSSMHTLSRSAPSLSSVSSLSLHSMQQVLCSPKKNLSESVARVFNLHIMNLIAQERFKEALQVINWVRKYDSLDTSAQFERIELLKRAIVNSDNNNNSANQDSAIDVRLFAGCRSKTDLLDRLLQENVALMRNCRTRVELAKCMRNCSVYFKLGDELAAALACVLKSLRFDACIASVPLLRTLIRLIIQQQKEQPCIEKFVNNDSKSRTIDPDFGTPIGGMTRRASARTLRVPTGRDIPTPRTPSPFSRSQSRSPSPVTPKSPSQNLLPFILGKKRTSPNSPTKQLPKSLEEMQTQSFRNPNPSLPRGSSTPSLGGPVLTRSSSSFTISKGCEFPEFLRPVLNLAKKYFESQKKGNTTSLPSSLPSLSNFVSLSLAFRPMTSKLLTDTSRAGEKPTKTKFPLNDMELAVQVGRLVEENPKLMQWIDEKLVAAGVPLDFNPHWIKAYQNAAKYYEDQGELHKATKCREHLASQYRETKTPRTQIMKRGSIDSDSDGPLYQP